MSGHSRANEGSLSPLVSIVDNALLVARAANTAEPDTVMEEVLTPVEAMLLRHVDRFPGITPSALSDDLRLRPSNTSVALKDLEAKTLLVRKKDPMDRRSMKLYATTRGLAVIAGMHRAWEKEYAAHGLNERELKQLASLIGRLQRRDERP